MKSIECKQFKINKDSPLTVMTGPCIIESETHALMCASELKKIFEKRNLQLIFKASYDKANRSSINSFRGPGIEEGLKILAKIQSELDLPVVTDIHTPEEAAQAAEVVDILQIPAFLCRQTDLLIAAGQTQRPINVKKGQFMAPWDMKNVIDKILSTGNENIILCERGVSFGYNTLISDMRSIPIMSQYGFPVCFDASHSVQQPGGLGNQSGGQREFIPVLAKAAIAAGTHVLFIESHPNPKEAKSDAATVFPMDKLPLLLDQLEALYQLSQSFKDV